MNLSTLTGALFWTIFDYIVRGFSHNHSCHDIFLLQNRNRIFVSDVSFTFLRFLRITKQFFFFFPGKKIHILVRQFTILLKIQIQKTKLNKISRFFHDKRTV